MESKAIIKPPIDPCLASLAASAPARTKEIKEQKQRDTDIDRTKVKEKRLLVIA